MCFLRVWSGPFPCLWGQCSIKWYILYKFSQEVSFEPLVYGGVKYKFLKFVILYPEFDPDLLKNVITCFLGQALPTQEMHGPIFLQEKCQTEAIVIEKSLKYIENVTYKI